MSRPFSEKKGDLPETKSLVAICVWKRFIITDKNPRVIIDAGSSAEAIALVIKKQVQKQPKGEEITAPGLGQGSLASSQQEQRGVVIPSVFTHNLGAWQVLSSIQKIEVYLIGGRYNPDLNAIIEPKVFEDQLKLWSPNIAVIAVSGIDEEGLYCSNIQDEHPVKELLAKKKVERRLIVCDHSKIGRTDTRRFISLEELKVGCAEVYLITDEYDPSQIEPKYLQPRYTKTLAAFREEHGEDKVIEVEITPPPTTSTASAPDPLPPDDFLGPNEEGGTGSTVSGRKDGAV